jgi:hypothetical protein
VSCLDPQPLLGAGDLVAVHRVGELAQLVLEPTHLAPQPGAFGVALGAGRLPRAGRLSRAFGALPQPGRSVCRPRPDRGRHP